MPQPPVGWRIMKTGMPFKAHGTLAGYNEWLCRCPACKGRMTRHRREREAAKTKREQA